jgi:hypothetical protein
MLLARMGKIGTAKSAMEKPEKHPKIRFHISTTPFPIRSALRTWRLGGEAFLTPNAVRIPPQYGNRPQRLPHFARIHQDLGHSLPLATLLESPTLRTLASRIDQSPN